LLKDARSREAATHVNSGPILRGKASQMLKRRLRGPFVLTMAVLNQALNAHDAFSQP